MNKQEKQLIKEQLVNFLTANNMLDEINEYCESMGFVELYDFLND